VSLFAKSIAFLPSACAPYAGKTVMPPPPGSVSIVVRHVHERTLDWCVGALREAFPQAPLRLVSAMPFDACLRRAYEASLEMGAPWSLHVDADALCVAEPLYQLMDFAGKQRRNVFSLSGILMDNFFLFPRAAGAHLYRTEYLRQALRFFLPTGSTTRPETSVRRAMAKCGYPTIQTDFVLGLHDYEQYYRHIVKKSALFRNKFSHFEELLPYWREKAENPDFAVALLGVNTDDIPADDLLNDGVAFERLRHIPLPEEKKPLPMLHAPQETIRLRLADELNNTVAQLLSRIAPTQESFNYLLGPVFPALIERIKFLTYHSFSKL